MIRSYPLPKNQSSLRAFLGVVGYCRQWIPNMSQIAKPLYALTSGKVVHFELSAEEIQAIEALKAADKHKPVG